MGLSAQGAGAQMNGVSTAKFYQKQATRCLSELSKKMAGPTIPFSVPNDSADTCGGERSTNWSLRAD
uniref:Uncharacterized protein n=1 Tax=Parascaris equorum TaxID=6256 RepID=A0A914RB97_PAREQ